jgi:Lrp/AsnC family transcriptional regulator, leucine-responsive regulatory protein
MNRSRYLTRHIDDIDRAIIAALSEDGRRTFKKVAELIGMSTPSITARIDKLKDAKAIRGYTAVVDPKAFGLNVEAHVRIHAQLGEGNRVAQMLRDTPEVVEADQITGRDCFQVKVVVSDAEQLHGVIARFEPFASVDTAIIMANTVTRRLPNLLDIP